MGEATNDLTGFQFYKFMFHGISWEKLVLPDKFANKLKDCELHDVKLRMAGGGRRAWDVKVVVDDYGDMYLDRGWQEFSRANGLELGQLLVFRYDGASVLTVEVFDESECQRDHQHGDAGSGSGSEDGGGSDAAEMDAGADTVPPQFTVTLRQVNFGTKQNQYLNVPVEFQNAHGYETRSKVLLRMRGKSWAVNLRHGKRPRNGEPRTWLRYGWHQFCVDNNLQVGDTCFFRVLREGDAGRGDDHVLKVEVRKRDGTSVH